MEIYTPHPTDFDYQSKYYDVVRDSSVYGRHTFVFPHDSSEALFDSKEYFASGECELVLAEVSVPSFGVGIELGWADWFDIPVVCVHQSSTSPSSSLNAITNQIHSYSTQEELRETIETIVRDFE